MSLSQLLHRVSPDRVLWLTDGRIPISAGQILNWRAAHRDLLQRVTDRRVAVSAVDGQQLAALLVLLDGVCAQLLLLPADAANGEIAPLLAHSRTEFVVRPSDVGALDCDVPQIAVEVGTWHHHFTSSPRPVPVASRTRWFIPTSGTTGTRKLIEHSLRSLTRTVNHDLDRGRDYRWASLYNPTGFAGLQVFLQSWMAGSTLILDDPQDDFSSRVQRLVDGQCNALSATPTMWRKLLMTPFASRLPLKQITLGGEIVDQAILNALRQTYPQARLIHIYASTEAGVGFAVRDGLAGFPASFLTDPPRGIRIAVDDRGHLLLGRGHPGAGQDGQRLLDTGDLVQQDVDAGRYYFLGRASGMINVGGNKVLPEEIEQVLLGFPGVAMVRVTARPNPITGSLVEAHVALESDRHSAQVRGDLIRHCRQHLAAYKVPAVLKFVQSLDTAASGKMRRAVA